MMIYVMGGGGSSPPLSFYSMKKRSGDFGAARPLITYIYTSFGNDTCVTMHDTYTVQFLNYH